MSQEQNFKFDTEHGLWYSRQYDRQTGQLVFKSWMPRGWQPQEPHTPRPSRRDSGHPNSPPHQQGVLTQPTYDSAFHYNTAPGYQLQQQPYTQASSSTPNAYGGPTARHSYTQAHPQQGQARSFPRGEGDKIEPHHTQYDVLSPDFVVRRKNFFVEGRVFAIMLSENAGSTLSRYDSSITEVSYQGHFVRTGKRRFVVVRQRREFCFACPIFTYSGRATTKSGVQPREHGIVYSIGYAPQCIPGETGIVKPPIGVHMTSAPALQIESRIYYGIHYPIQYNVKVADVGLVQEEDIPKLMGNWNEETPGESNQDQDVTANAEVPPPAEREDADEFLYDETNNPYGYHATASPYCFHPRLNCWGYNVSVNPNGYHPDWNPQGYHPTIAPDFYHAQHNECGYHSSINPHGYHPQLNPHGHHKKKVPWVFHPKHNPLIYHPTNNKYVYHPEHNAHTWDQKYNPFSYHQQYNPTGHYPSGQNLYAYHPVHAPYMYHSTANPRGFHTYHNKYGYHPQWNQYAYHHKQNPTGYHPQDNPTSYHPDHNPGGQYYSPPSQDSGIAQLTSAVQGFSLGNPQ